VSIVLYALQSRLVWFPTSEIVATPEDVGLAYEEVTLTADDGVQLAAWYVPAGGESRGTILYCHGNAGNISTRLPTMHLCHRLGLDILAFDYRGYGRSEGRPSEEGTYRDARAAWEYLVHDRGVEPRRIVVVGRSLGGAIASRLACDREVAGVSLECAFTAVPDVAAEKFWFLPARWLTRIQYPTIEHVRRLDCPVMICHSPEDRLIPFHHGEQLYAAAGEPKDFVRLTGPHNAAVHEAGATYTEALGQFVDDCIAGSN
jgi:hypothetical protein